MIVYNDYRRAVSYIVQFSFILTPPPSGSLSVGVVKFSKRWENFWGVGKMRSSVHRIVFVWSILTTYGSPLAVVIAPCGLQGCRNRPATFSGPMSYKATKPRSVCPLSSPQFFECVVLLTRATFALFCVFFVFCILVVLARLQVIGWKDSSPK